MLNILYKYVLSHFLDVTHTTTRQQGVILLQVLQISRVDTFINTRTHLIEKEGK